MDYILLLNLGIGAYAFCLIKSYSTQLLISSI